MKLQVMGAINLFGFEHPSELGYRHRVDETFIVCTRGEQHRAQSG